MVTRIAEIRVGLWARCDEGCGGGGMGVVIGGSMVDENEEILLL